MCEQWARKQCESAAVMSRSNHNLRDPPSDHPVNTLSAQLARCSERVNSRNCGLFFLTVQLRLKHYFDGLCTILYLFTFSGRNGLFFDVWGIEKGRQSPGSKFKIVQMLKLFSLPFNNKYHHLEQFIYFFRLIYGIYLAMVSFNPSSGISASESTVVHRIEQP